MRNVSNAYLETMQKRRDFYATAEITFADGVKKTVEKEDLRLSGNSIIHSAGSSTFPLGMLVAKIITFSLNNEDDQWSEYDFFGAKIQLFTRFLLDNGNTESLNIGEFTVITPETYGSTIEVTAMDESYKTDVEYSTSLDYPLSLGVALRDSCRTCNITLITSTFANDDFVINNMPENLTHRQFIGLCAMLAGGNAVLDEYNRLKIITYNLSSLDILGLDGGKFDKLGLSSYSTGDTADGGAFNPWNTGYVMDGGKFGDRKNLHILYEIKSGMTIGVDDVVITGVQMQDEEDNVHLYGKEGYVISVENQLAAGKEEEAVKRIGDIIVGLLFRPFAAEHIAYPLAEFMDAALIIDRKQNIYKTVLTDVEFSYFGFTKLKCNADSPLRNSSKFNSEAAKAVVAARKLVKEERTEREKAIETFAKELANSSGLYMTADKQPDGSTIYYMHDKPTLEESMIVWKLTAEAFGISTDGGKTYPYGLDATGMAILSRIYAIGLDADYITTGSLLVKKGDKTMLLADIDTGEVRIVADSFSLSSGATIDSIAEEKSKAAANSAVNDFVNAVYDPQIAALQEQIDGQIETYYYDYEPTLNNLPASEWTTEEERLNHEGDLFYWKSKGYAYRFFKNGNTWEWSLIADTDITLALKQAAEAQATADGKARVFYRTPTPPYDLYDLWAQGSAGDIMICINARQSGNYVASDWAKSNDYIDKALAYTIANDSLTDFLQNEYYPTLEKIQNQADQKSENWYQATDPSEEWLYIQDSNGDTITDSSGGKLEVADAAGVKKEHEGDLWYNTTEQKIYYYTGEKWELTTTDVPDELFDKIDGKSSTYISQPTPPYYVGDTWFNSATSDILTCIKTRETGSYNSSDWQKRNKYTDDTAAKEEAERAKGQEEILATAINVNKENIVLEASRAKGEEERLSAAININANSIIAEVKRAQEQESSLASSIKINADSITSEVTRAKNAESSLSSSIIQTAEQISSKVSRGNLSSEISQEAGKITLSGDRLVINSSNFELTADGKLTIKGNGLIKGSTIEGSTLYSTDNESYVEIADGFIEGGRLISGKKSLAGWFDFGATLDGNQSLDIRATNLVLCATHFGVGEKRDATTVDVASQTYDMKYVVQIKDNGDGTITWTNSTVKFRNGILVSH